MSEHEHEHVYLEPARVHIAGSDVPLANHPPARKSRHISLRTIVLTANDPIQQILPQNANRIEAYVQNVDTAAKNFTIYASRADAGVGGNAGVTVPKSNTTPYPICATDGVWATAAAVDLPVAISVEAIIEGD